MAEHPALAKRSVASEKKVLTNKQIERYEPNREKEVAQTYCALGGSLPALNRDRFRPDVCARPNRRSTIAPTDGAACSEPLSHVGVLLLRLLHGVGKERHPPHGSKQATNPLPHPLGCRTSGAPQRRCKRLTLPGAPFWNNQPLNVNKLYGRQRT